MMVQAIFAVAVTHICLKWLIPHDGWSCELSHPPILVKGPLALPAVGTFQSINQNRNMMDEECGDQ